MITKADDNLRIFKLSWAHRNSILGSSILSNWLLSCLKYEFLDYLNQVFQFQSILLPFVTLCQIFFFNIDLKNCEHQGPWTGFRRCGKSAAKKSTLHRWCFLLFKIVLNGLKIHFSIYTIYYNTLFIWSEEKSETVLFLWKIIEPGTNERK